MKSISDSTLADLAERAAGNPRRRTNLNLHDTLEEPVQRMLNALEPDSYVRPHRHAGASRWELFLALAGRCAVLLFGDDGRVTERREITPGGPELGLEIPGGRWHTIAALEPGTVLFEIKEGPYLPLGDKDFADWAPPEGYAACPAFVEWFRNAGPGDRPPAWAVA